MIKKERGQAIADAILTPHSQRLQEQKLTRKNMAERLAAEEKNRGPYTLAGMFLGASLGYYWLANDWFVGIVVGMLSGAVLGRVLARVKVGNNKHEA